MRATKLRIFRQLWAISGQEYIQQLSKDKLKLEKEKAVKLEAEGEGVGDAGAV